MTLIPTAVSIAAAADLSPTFGYLDPGTGSYALQLILAGAFGGLYALKQSWQQVRSRLGRLRSMLRSGDPSLEATD